MSGKVKGAEKQYLQVLRAIEEGAETSEEVSLMIDMPVNKVSAYLTYLHDAGLIEVTAYNARRYTKSGPRSHQYKRAGAAP